MGKKVDRKKFGYTRSGNLTICGRLLILFSMILDCKTRGSPYTPALLQRAEDMEVDLSQYDDFSIIDMHKEVGRR